MLYCQFNFDRSPKKMHERQKRKLRSCCKTLLFIAFFWCLIYFGFQDQNVDLDFGEHLDGAHMMRLRNNSRRPFYKFLNETLAEVRKSRIEMLKSDSNEDASISSDGLKSYEKRILKEFLIEKPTTLKKIVLITEHRKNDKTSEVTNGIVWKETVGPNGEYQDDYYQQIRNLDNFSPRKIDIYPEIIEKNALNDLKRKQEEVESIKLEPPSPDKPPDLENVEVALNKLNPDVAKINENIQKDEEEKSAVVFGPQPESAKKSESSEKKDKKSSSTSESSKTQEKSSKNSKSSSTTEKNSKAQNLSSKNSNKSEKPSKHDQNLAQDQKSSDDTKNSKNLEVAEKNNSEPKVVENLAQDLENSSDQSQKTLIQNVVPKSDSSSSDKASSIFGDFGNAVVLPNDLTPEVKKLVDEGWKKHQFNEYVSNLISPQRNLLDFRTEYCISEKENYSKELPEVSIIIVFYNEAWSTLTRSIYSIIDRSPEKLIKEIILVDDCSEFEHLKGQLDEFIAQFEKVMREPNSGDCVFGKS